MNTLYIIGNGFDLAHGLKTSYNDFLLWYLKQCFEKKFITKEFDDGLTLLKGPIFRGDLNRYKNIKELLDAVKFVGGTVTFQAGFIKNIFGSLQEYNWVDIESKYYESLIEIIKKNYDDTSHIKLLNSQLNLLKSKLEEYLLTLNKSCEMKEEIKKHFEDRRPRIQSNKLVVNFNYTSTVDQYIAGSLYYSQVNIHGRLNDPKNPLIFGYSNTKSPEYEKIHSSDIEFQKYIKLFLYSETNNYRIVTDFLEENDFIVKVLGHSCGMSDGDILGKIFMHEKCKRIEICFYEKSENENDFSDKTRIISKHFPASKQSEFLEKMITKDHATALIPFKSSKNNVTL